MIKSESLVPGFCHQSWVSEFYTDSYDVWLCADGARRFFGILPPKQGDVLCLALYEEPTESSVQVDLLGCPSCRVNGVKIELCSATWGWLEETGLGTMYATLEYVNGNQTIRPPFVGNHQHQ